jgi:aminopeptidase N
MEYPGLNLIGLDLYRDRRADLENRVAHEISHQWWYAQVGNDQINTPWLDEGLAEYSTAIYYRDAMGENYASSHIEKTWLAPYQVAVDSGYDTQVNQPTAAFGQNYSLYEVVVYGKAALFFEALRQEVGNETFLKILRAYVNGNRWQIATPTDFVDVATEVSGQDMEQLYDYWILSSR